MPRFKLERFKPNDERRNHFARLARKNWFGRYLVRCRLGKIDMCEVADLFGLRQFFHGQLIFGCGAERADILWRRWR